MSWSRIFFLLKSLLVDNLVAVGFVVLAVVVGLLVKTGTYELLASFDYDEFARKRISEDVGGAVILLLLLAAGSAVAFNIIRAVIHAARAGLAGLRRYMEAGRPR
jgi:hypothetical protein